MTDTEKVNPGSQDTRAATVSMVIPFAPDDLARLQRACDHVSAQRGERYTPHDLICDAVTLAVKDIEAGYPDDGGTEDRQAKDDVPVDAA